MKDVLRPFAEAAWSLELSRRSSFENEKLEGLLRYCIGRCIRTSSNLLIPACSQAALALAAHIGVNLFAAKEGQKARLTAHCLTLKTDDHFFYEHKETVYELTARIGLSNDLEEVVAIFKSQTVVWILNSENRRLIENGHNASRPDSDLAYQIADIHVTKSIYTDFNDYDAASWRL